MGDRVTVPISRGGVPTDRRRGSVTRIISIVQQGHGVNDSIEVALDGGCHPSAVFLGSELVELHVVDRLAELDR